MAPTLSGPAGVCIFHDGSIIFTEYSGHRVRRISADRSTVTTLAGSDIMRGAASAGGGDLDLLQHVGTTLTLIEAAGSRSVVKWTTSEVDDALQWAALVESGLDSLPSQFDASSVVASALSSWCEQQQQQQQQCGQRWVRDAAGLGAQGGGGGSASGPPPHRKTVAARDSPSKRVCIFRAPGMCAEGVAGAPRFQPPPRAVVAGWDAQRPVLRVVGAQCARLAGRHGPT